MEFVFRVSLDAFKDTKFFPEARSLRPKLEQKQDFAKPNPGNKKKKEDSQRFLNENEIEKEFFFSWKENGNSEDQNI